MKGVFYHEWANPIPLPTGRQATPDPLNPPKGEIHERGAMKIIDFVNLCDLASLWQKTIASLPPCELCVKSFVVIPLILCCFSLWILILQN